MKKFITFVFALAFAVDTLGCAGKPNDMVKNDVFTDAFFTDVEQIYFCAVSVSGEQMEPVIRYLKGLTLAPTAATEQQVSTKDRNEPVRYGFYSLRFLKTNGEEVGMILDSGSIGNEALGTYRVEEDNFIENVRAFFGTEDSE